MSETKFLDHPKFHSPDSMPIQMTSDLLDLDRVTTHIHKATELSRYQGPQDPVDYLVRKQCLIPLNDHLYPTLAGILCFGRNPQETFPNAVVDVGHYYGTEAVSFELLDLQKNIGRTIFDQLERVEEYLWRNTNHGMVLPERGFERREVHEYPRAVIRELGVNMLAHRDYTILGSASRVMLFKDRIEWVSPGGLPPGVSVQDILAVQYARNPVVLSILYEAGYVEAFGQGLDTVVSVLRREKMRDPIFQDVGAAFIVTVYGRQQESIRIDASRYIQLSEEQIRILNVIRARGEASLRNLEEHLPHRGRRTLQRDVRELVDAGIVEALGATRSLRYRLRS